MVRSSQFRRPLDIWVRLFHREATFQTVGSPLTVFYRGYVSRYLSPLPFPDPLTREFCCAVFYLSYTNNPSFLPSCPSISIFYRRLFIPVCANVILRSLKSGSRIDSSVAVYVNSTSRPSQLMIISRCLLDGQSSTRSSYHQMRMGDYHCNTKNRIMISTVISSMAAFAANSLLHIEETHHLHAITSPSNWKSHRSHHPRVSSWLLSGNQGGMLLCMYGIRGKQKNPFNAV